MKCPFNNETSSKCYEEPCCMSCRYVMVEGDMFPCKQCSSVADPVNSDGFTSRCLYTMEVRLG